MFLVCALAPLSALVWAATVAGRVLDGRTESHGITWVAQLGLRLDLRVDAFSLLMIAIVSGIGVLVFWYAASYFERDTPRIGSFAANLTAFAGAMLGLVVADNVFVIFVFWELTSVTSFLLIGHDDRRAEARGAASQALLVTGGGGLVLLAGFVLLTQEAGTASLSGIIAAAPTGGTVPAALLCVLIGAAAKSAQVPFHFWLPGAMVAPTPVSAYLHSATMVKAGVYLIARLAPAFAAEGVWRPAVLVLGLGSMFLGGWVALREHDLKRILAYGTISQLGFLTVLFGIGEPALTAAGCVMIAAHALFKAALFMVAGIIDHSTGTRDVRELSGLARGMPVVFAISMVAAASMAGLPPLLGFVAKEKALAALLDATSVSAALVTTGVVVASMLTFAYSARLLRATFRTRPGVIASLHRPAPLFVAPSALLAALTVATGLAPVLIDRLVRRGARALDPQAGSSELVLIPHLDAALALSVVTVLGGVAVLLAGRAIEQLPRTRERWHAAHWYRVAVRDLLRVAQRTTAVVQSGSQPVYLALVFVTVLALPGLALARHAPLPDDIELAQSGAQVATAGLVVVAAVATALMRRRMAAVLTVGAVGYLTAVLFMLQGAPDLALVQFLIETLSVAVFVLVLRRLPERFERGPSMQWPRVALSTVIGCFAALAVLVTSGARTSVPISELLVRDSLTEAGGRNVVNVILVDFRGFDTLGEITVLFVAALGILSLALAGVRSSNRRPGGSSAPGAPLPSQAESAP